MKMTTLRDHYVSFGSLERAADDLGISKNNLQLWLSGRFKPCWKSQQKLRKAGISLEAFPD